MSSAGLGYLDRLRRRLAAVFTAGLAHRRRLQRLDTRIVVTGVRGKSTVTRWLHDIFHSRGYDTYAKVTGTEPVSLYNGTETEIPRAEQVRLYENERELQKYEPEDVAIFENQGIREYTTRLVNGQFVRPEVLFLTNVREDHLGTLGTDRLTIARSLARAVPSNSHVVVGEQDETIREFLEVELGRRNATVSHVDVPERDRSLPGAECVHGIDEVLRAVGERPLTHRRRQLFRQKMAVSWTELPSGRVYNAAAVNDVQSTEAVRQSLLDDAETVVEPLIYVRGDRRGRTASFRRYFDRLFEDGEIHTLHAVGPDADLLAQRTAVPTETYDTDAVEPGELLDSALSAGRPVFVVGNTVSEFMRALNDEIERRATGESAHERPTRVPGHRRASHRRRLGTTRLARRRARRRSWGPRDRSAGEQTEDVRREAERGRR